MCRINCSGGCPQCSPEDHDPFVVKMCNELVAAEQRFADLLLTLRNPTDAMVEAGNNSASVQMEHDSELGSYAWIDNSAEVLSAMLDAALNPNPEA